MPLASGSRLCTVLTSVSHYLFGVVHEFHHARISVMLVRSRWSGRFARRNEQVNRYSNVNAPEETLDSIVRPNSQAYLFSAFYDRLLMILSSPFTKQCAIMKQCGVHSAKESPCTDPRLEERMICTSRVFKHAA